MVAANLIGSLESSVLLHMGPARFLQVCERGYGGIRIALWLCWTSRLPPSIANTSGITDSGFVASEGNRHLRIKIFNPAQFRFESISLGYIPTALPVIDQTTQAALASKDVKPNLAEPNDPQAKLIFVVERSGSYAINVDLAATDFGTPSNDIALELQSSDGSLRNRLALPSDGRAVRSGANP